MLMYVTSALSGSFFEKTGRCQRNNAAVPRSMVTACERSAGLTTGGFPKLSTIPALVITPFTPSHVPISENPRAVTSLCWNRALRQHTRSPIQVRVRPVNNTG